jgi:MoxR-like ATPase
MSKNSKSNRRSNPYHGRPGGGSPQAGRAAILERARREAADRASAEKAAAAEGVDVGAVAVPAADSPGQTGDALRDTLAALDSKRAIYEECAARADQREEQAAAELRRAIEAAAAARAERAELDRERENLDAQTVAIRELGTALDEREKAILARETEADAGFPARLAAAQDALDADLASRRERAIDDMRTAQEAHEATLKVQRESLETERKTFAAWVAAQTEDLDRQRRSLAEDQAEAGRESAEVRGERITLERRQLQLDQEVKARSAMDVGSLEADLHIAQAEVGAARESIARLAEELAELRTRWAAVGVDDPRRILSALLQTQDQNRELQDKLAARLDDDSLARLRWLEEQNRDFNAERERLQFELQEERGKQLADRINNLQLQQLTDAQQQFDVIKRGYDMRISELNGALSELVDGRADPTDPLFPNCVALDEDPRLNEAGHLIDDEVPDLHQLALSLQGTMWRQSKRAYFLDDVCGVLGGLAMSQLHLLEGRSGIGKTSLPKALAAALGTECVIIEVQAGWRDRHDLFGHYNTFERRFQEEPFLLALYKALTPRYRDRPFFIVLDEMNLARPEQYFSVLLSRLESGDTEPVKLAPVSTGRKPRRMDESGTGIALPGNVWFIGTANQDESTLEFADKTYNRSFVLELPVHRPFVPSRGEQSSYSVSALRRAFDQASYTHGAALTKVQGLLDDLADEFYDVGRVELDPRLKNQLQKFVPVVVAARGTDVVNEAARGDFKVAERAGQFDPVALAADQFISSKLLHQLHSRFEVTTEGIKQLEQIFELYWPERFGGAVPARCRKVLADEQRRRRA